MKRLLRALVRLALEVFFGELSVLGRDRLPRGVPVMLCPNHPSAGMDALLLGAVFGERVHYIAKSTLFKNPVVGGVLRYLGAIPVHRKQDAPGAGQPGEKNLEAFAAARDVLARGKWLAIFPEGTSIGAGRLLPLKTGAARIAFETEEEHAFGMGLAIVPVGLSYTASSVFRSQVAIAVGEPIAVAGWRARYEADPQAAVRDLTTAIDRGIQDELAYVPQDSLASLALAIETIYETEGLVPEEMAERLQARERIKDAVLHFAEHDPVRVEKACVSLARYRRKLARLRLSDRVVAAHLRPRPGTALLLLELVAEAPVAIYGTVNHLVAYNVPRAAVIALTPDPTYVSTVKLATGLVAFTACYALQTWLVAWATGSLTAATLYAASLPLTGALTLHYASRLEHARDRFAILRGITGRRREKILGELARERAGLLALLERSRQEHEAALAAAR